MYSAAPISSPRVGWAATTTSGSLESSRPTMSFCWLPPERDFAGASRPGAWMEKARMSSRACEKTLPQRSTESGPRKSGERCLPRMEFSATVKERIRPYFQRSSGM